jgi:gamma-glutamyltranspeptidase / glutathione hydrolase
MQHKGVVAAGHEHTAKAAEIILQAGGNAFDAIIAAHLAACVVEPVLSSLAGGGYLLAHTAGGKNILYDFFAQTPRDKRDRDDTDFFPISADFGTTTQEFHIGLGSIATPGTVKGLFNIHADLCNMPMPLIAEPAITLARDGVVMNAFQAYIFDIVKAIYLHSPTTRKIFGSIQGNQTLLQEGELLKQPELADSLDAIAREGEKLFYQGEIATAAARLCTANGGHLTEQDFHHYQTIKRSPLTVSYRQATLLTNPPPSSGGILIAFALKLLESLNLSQYRFGTAPYLALLASVQKMTNKARIDAFQDKDPDMHLLNPEYLADYQQHIKDRHFCSRGTTHISIIDKQGNIASLTTSNGEGCGHFIPGTGIMLNNMLGEEDINPQGFHHWPVNQRMTSMMAPGIVFLPDNRRIALGSGGSNRLRTAILQVLLNLIDFAMPLDQAVTRPRIHHEAGHLNVEGGFDPAELKLLLQHFPDHKVWEEANLFFGGTHTVSTGKEGYASIGDPRRGGHSIIIN